MYIIGPIVMHADELIVLKNLVLNHALSIKPLVDETELENEISTLLFIYIMQYSSCMFYN